MSSVRLFICNSFFLRILFCVQIVLCALAEVVSLRFINGVGPRPGIMGIDYSTAFWLYTYVINTTKTEFLGYIEEHKELRSNCTFHLLVNLNKNLVALALYGELGHPMK